MPAGSDTDLSSEQPATAAESIVVLLVDDNEQWATFLAGDLETEDDGLEVVVALSANEAMVLLDDRDDIDCVVADYRMPEVDGLQLLDRIREDHPHLPFILMTGAGSEEVASTAIDAGVTDYLVKNPKVDQTSLLTRRIRAAYDRYALQTALEESEQRYRTVTEQTWDAIVVLEGGAISFCNERLAALVGRHREELDGCEFVTDFVHEDDAAAIEDFLVGVDDDARLHEARLITDDGAVRHVELTRRKLTDAGTEALLVSIRDITERTLRQRRLNRERSLNRAVMNVLIEARTREELEGEVVSRLTEHGYDLAWIGTATSGDPPNPRVVSGSTSYVDWLAGLDRSALPDDEPSLVSGRKRATQAIPDVAELFPTRWRDRLMEAGFRGVAALPIAYDDLYYGLLAVYHEEPEFIDENEIELLGEFSETVAFAVHHLETHKTLASERSLAVELAIPSDAHYLYEALVEGDLELADIEATVVGTHTGKDDTVVQYVEIGDGALDAVVDTIDAHPWVDQVSPIEDDHQQRLQVSLDRSPPERVLAARGAVLRPTAITPSEVVLRCEISSRAQLANTVDALEAAHGRVDVQSVVETEQNTAPGSVTRLIELSALTDKQNAAMKAAYHHGYFEQPRAASATEIAESLDVTHSTYLQHLRSAQRKLLEQLYSESDES